MGLSDRKYAHENYDRNTGRFRPEGFTPSKSKNPGAYKGVHIVEIDGREKTKKRLEAERAGSGYKGVHITEIDSRDATRQKVSENKRLLKEHFEDRRKARIRTSIALYAIFFFTLFSFVSAWYDSTQPHLEPTPPVVESKKDSAFVDSSIVVPPPSAPVVSCPETSVFYSGFTSSSTVSPFSFHVPPNGGHYFIKVKDAQDKSVVLSAFVRSGDFLDTRLPAGRYLIYMATGTEWKGEKDLFGALTEYSYGSKVLDFSANRGHRVSITKTAGGNYNNSPIFKGDF